MEILNVDLSIPYIYEYFFMLYQYSMESPHTRSTTGFIILRHVKNKTTDAYWKHCYDCVRKYYPENKILIIDDNSNPQSLTEKETHNTTVIQSEYPGRGELLPYYYYLHNKLFDVAVILHDSVFLNSHIKFETSKSKFHWHFNANRGNDSDKELNMLHVFQDKSLVDLYLSKKWRGCFGGMATITHDHLVASNKQYDLSKFLDIVTDRPSRCTFERIIACILYKCGTDSSLMGDLHKYLGKYKFGWGTRFKNIGSLSHVPLIKVWTGR